MPITREEELTLLDPASYYRQGYPWCAWRKLRQDDPVHYVDRGENESFWAVTRHKDIVSIEGNTEVFKNGPRLIMGSVSEDMTQLIVNMDPPQHTFHRVLAKPHFTPQKIEWAQRFAEEIVTDALDRAMERNGEVVDLQEDVANLVPTAVISAFLGVPRELWPKVIEWTNQIINADDPRVAKDQGGLALARDVSTKMTQVYAKIFAERRENPRDDFMSALVNGQIDGRPLSDPELYSWAFILTTAGHETTQSTFTLGVHALMQHPDQFSKLKANPELLPRAIEELLRYVSPAIHFLRTPNRDVEIHGKKIRAGEHLAMFYPSANRDADIFDEPDRLDIERLSNRHMAFGGGIHQCLGMHFARLELRIMFEHFLKRVDKIEVAATPERVYAVATGGYKHFPVRMSVGPR